MITVDPATITGFEALAAGPFADLDDMGTWKRLLSIAVPDPAADAYLTAAAQRLIVAADYQLTAEASANSWADALTVDHDELRVRIDPARVWPTVTVFTHVLALTMVVYGPLPDDDRPGWRTSIAFQLAVTDLAAAMIMTCHRAANDAIRDLADPLRRPDRLATVVTDACALARRVLAALDAPASDRPDA